MPSLRGRILNNPLYRLLFAVVALVFLMHLLRSSWKGQEKTPANVPARPARERKAVAHFMVRPTPTSSMKEIAERKSLGIRIRILRKTGKRHYN